jgi:hypothetical protein
MAEIVFDIYGPDGTLWFTRSDTTTRVVGSFILTGPPNTYITSDPPDGRVANAWNRKFPCPPNAKPFVYGYATAGLTIQLEVSRFDTNTANLFYRVVTDGGIYRPGDNQTVSIIYGYC